MMTTKRRHVVAVPPGGFPIDDDVPMPVGGFKIRSDIPIPERKVQQRAANGRFLARN